MWGEVVSNDYRCGKVPVAQCDVRVRIRSLLAVHHLDANEITWWERNASMGSDMRGPH